MKTLDSILESEGITVDHKQVSSIRKELFEVIGFPKPAPHLTGSDALIYSDVAFEAPKGINLYKSTGGACIGEAGDTYGILQPNDFFDAITVALKRIGYDFDKNEIEYLPTNEGRKISFKIPLREIKFKNKAKRGDITEVYALFTTSFDGSTSTTLALFSKRVLCENMELFNHNKETCFKFRHTPKMNLRALSYVDAIMQASQGIEKIENIVKALDKIELRTEKQINAVIGEILGYDVSDAKELHKKRQAQLDEIRNGWAIERKRTGNTAYGLYNAFTYVSNHDLAGEHRGFDYAAFGTGARNNNKVHKVMHDLKKVNKLVTI